MFKKISAGMIGWGLIAMFMIFLITSAYLNRTTKITKVIDGDTIIVSGDKIVRLARIDTPEFGENNYWDAKAFMKDYLNKEIKLECEDQKGYYDRYICEVYHDEVSLNQRLLNLGLAEPYKK
jgi:endonuclease YncB( thermonuclease family)